MSPRGPVLERNLEALLSRSYVPVLPRPAYRDGLIATLRGEVARKRTRRPRPTPWLVLPLAAAAAALILVWLRPPTPGAEPPATLSQLLAAGQAAIEEGSEGEAGAWRAASAEELASGVRLEQILGAAVPDGVDLDLIASGGRATLHGPARVRGSGAEPRLFLEAGALTLKIESGAGSWTLGARADGPRVHVDGGSALEARRDGERTLLRLGRGRAQVEGPEGAWSLTPGDERALEAPVPAPGPVVDRDGAGRQPLEGAPDPAGTESGEPAQETPRRAAVRGTVRGADGSPLEAFRVLLLLDRDVPEVELPELRRYRDGRFLWDDLEPDRYEIFVEAEGHAQARLGVHTLEEGKPLDLDLQLQRGSDLRGWVLDRATEAPVPGAWVVIETEVPSKVLPFELETLPDWVRQVRRSAADGSWAFANVSEGEHVLRVSAPGYGPVWTRVRVEAEGPLPADVFVRLDPGGEVHGAVADETGQPLEGAVLLATIADDPSTTRLFSYRQAVTDAEGRFAFDDLAPGFYMLIQWNSAEEFEGDASPNLRPVVVRRGGVSTVRFGPAPREVRLHGRILDAAGRPQAGMKFTVLPREELVPGSDSNWQASATDGSGAYALSVPEPGSYLVFLTHGMGERLSLVDEIDVPEGEAELAHDVRLSTHSVLATVRRADDGSPEPRAEALLLRVDTPQPLFAGRGFTATDGSVRFDALVPGTYVVAADPAPDSLDLGEVSSTPIEVPGPDGRPQAVEDLLLPLAGSLRLRVVDAAGSPRPEARLELFDAAGQLLWPEGDDAPDARQEERGGLLIRGLEPGIYRVRAHSTDHGSATAEVEVPLGRVVERDLILEPLTREEDR